MNITLTLTKDQRDLIECCLGVAKRHYKHLADKHRDHSVGALYHQIQHDITELENQFNEHNNNPRKWLADNGYKYSHTSWARGYVSRKKPEGHLIEYEGRFGTGYCWHTPSWRSTNYHRVAYYIGD